MSELSVLAAVKSDRGNQIANRTSGSTAPLARSHYTIGEIAREFGFTLRALRFYEEKGLISPRRAGNRRLYSATERRRLTIIASGKKIGLSLDDIREILKADTSDVDESPMLAIALDKAINRLDALEQEKTQLQDFTREAVKLIGDLKSRLGQGTIPTSQ